MEALEDKAGKPTVIAALRRFIPAWLRTSPVVSVVQRRAIWAIEHCRTAMLGGSAHGCADCGEHHYAYHSCNNKACPQCGRGATAAWVERQQAQRLPVPYFMVTFTLPSELRPLFFGPEAKAVFDAFFAASSLALKEQLAEPRHLGAAVSGYSMVLHTWNQQLLFHPHIHCIVPGAGLDAQGNYVEVKKRDYLLPAKALRAALRHHFGQQLQAIGMACDPVVWRVKWGVHVQPFGNGENAIKYLGRYISRSVIGDSRIIGIDEKTVTLRWKDRAQGGVDRVLRLAGEEFTRRYLRHVLPDKLRAVRYYGYHHPSAKEKRQRVRLEAEARHGKAPPPTPAATPAPTEERATTTPGSPGPAEAPAASSSSAVAAAESSPQEKPKGYPCPCCGKAMRKLYTLPRGWMAGLEASHGARLPAQRAAPPPGSQGTQQHGPSPPT